MLSTDLIARGFKEWLKLKADYNYNKDFVLNLPREKGVYVIRAHEQIHRIKGTSDIIYIGQGTIQSRIQALLRSYLPLNFRNYMNKHTAREAFERVIEELCLELELSYIKCEKPKEFETGLLQLFCQDHIEPPPLNNTRR